MGCSVHPPCATLVLQCSAWAVAVNHGPRLTRKMTKAGMWSCGCVCQAEW